MTAAACYWTCIVCDLVGDRFPDADSHTRATGHCTITGTDPAVLARLRERVATS